MCNAMFVGMGVAAAGTVMKGIAEKQRGEAAKRADYQSADASERAAADAIDRGNLKELQVTMHGSSVVAAQRVIQSGSGADVNIGAPKATQEGTQAVSDLDRAVVRRNAALEAYGLKARAQGQRQHGENAEAEGNNAMIGTFLGGIAGIGGQAGQYIAGLKTSEEQEPERPSETDFNEQAL